MSAFQLNLAPLKEPLGFIKVLEWFFSIFSFATCGGYSGKTSIYVICKNETLKDNQTYEAAFGYPFRLNLVLLKGPDTICGEKWLDSHLIGDFSSPAQFYVAIAVLAFLYSMGALVLYLGYKHLYQASTKVPLMDFIFTVFFAFMWLVSSSAWAKGLTDIKYVTSSVNTPSYCNQSTKYSCHSAAEPHMGTLNISVAFGFLNLILWAGNAWFVYKETNLHTPPPDANPEQAPPSLSK